MPATLIEDQYGKSRVRVLKADRRRSPHIIRDLTVGIRLRGDFATAYRDGDNTAVLPTDTMKNTVYVIAQSHDLSTIEGYAAALATHFVDTVAPAHEAGVTVEEHRWDHARGAGEAHPTAFTAGSTERAVCAVTHGPAGTTTESTIRGLQLLRTAGSGFSDFLHDPYTTLQDTDDRLFGTSLDATWDYEPGATPGSSRGHVRAALIDTFATHPSPSVQHTLWAMGEAVLETCPDVATIHLSMPNVHRLLVDLSPFGRTNDNEVFLPVDEPRGVIEARMGRT